MILLLYVFPLQGSIQNNFINKVTRVHKVLTVANSISLCSTIFVVSWSVILVDRAEISHMNTPQNSTEPARLPGSYEEALRGDDKALSSDCKFSAVSQSR